jgi:PAS domain S-box-containing protein
VCVLAVLVPWRAVPELAAVVLPLLVVVSIGFLREAGGGSNSGYGSLYLVPALWAAVYATRVQLTLVLASIALAFWLPVVLVGGTEYPTSGWRGGALMVLGLALFSFVIQYLLEQLVGERQQYRELAAMTEASQDAMVRVKLDGTVVAWNPAAERTYGYTADEMLGRNLLLIVPDDRRGEVAELIARGRHGEPFPAEPLETVRLRKDGQRIDVSLTLSTIADEDGNTDSIAATIRDVTERNRAEREREEFQSKLAETQKLEAVGVLAGGLAHDFNNLLTVVLGNTSVLLASPALDASVRERLEQVRVAGERSADLARQMLAYSGRGRFMVKRVALAEVVVEMAGLLESTISKKAKLNLSLAPDTPVVEADVTQLRQVLLNLITNASEALGERSGRIDVSTGATVLGAGMPDGYEPDDVPAGRYAFLEVTDSGAGMSDETKAMIFDPFFTTKFLGRGLGLSAVQGIVRGHGGALKVDSRLGEGTSLRLLLPASESRVGRAEPGDANAGGSERSVALVADDEPGVRLLVAEMLEQLGFEVVAAADGVEFLEAFRGLRGAFALLILDLTMPRLNGDEVLRELASEEIPPVILMSGYNAGDLGQRVAGLGIAAQLQKPFDLEQFQRAIQQVLAPVRAEVGALASEPSRRSPTRSPSTTSS